MIFDGDLSRNEFISWILLGVFIWILGCSWFFWAVIITLYIVWFVRAQFIHVEWIDPRGKVVYITGCDSGFGKAAALALAELGFTVCAGCLNADNCDDLKTSSNIHVLDLDVSDDEKVKACAYYVEQICAKKGLWALYNNAGYATAGEIEWLPMDIYERQMDVNFLGSVRVTKSVLHLIRKAKGRVVTVTSGISRSVAPGRSPYSCSKAALEGFMDCLRYEMTKFGVKCITIQPGNLSGTTNVFSGMANQIKRVYDEMPAHVKEAYGSDYLKRFYELTIERYQTVGGPKNAPIDPVIKDIKHAIMSKNPRIRYKAAQMGWLIWWFFYNLLPEELTTLYMTKYCLKDFPEPASVSGENKNDLH